MRLKLIIFRFCNRINKALDELDLERPEEEQSTTLHALLQSWQNEYNNIEAESRRTHFSGPRTRNPYPASHR